MSDRRKQAAGFNINRLMLATGVACAEAIERVVGVGPFIGVKWPNDLIVDGRKLAGILVETMTTPAGQPVAILGLGINTTLVPGDLPTNTEATSTDNSDSDLHDRLISLAMLGHRVDRLRLLAELLPHIEQSLYDRGTDDLLNAWRTRSTLMMQRVHLRHDGRDIHGRVADLDPIEGLIVRLDSGELLHLPPETTTVVR